MAEHRRGGGGSRLDDIIRVDGTVVRVEGRLWLDAERRAPVRFTINAWDGEDDDPAFSLVATFDEFDSRVLQVQPPT